MARILAIDYGKKRVGIAVTDPLQIIASPLDTIDENKLMDFLRNYFLKEQVEMVVVGMPKNLNNEDTDATSSVKKFIANFKNTFSKKITSIDERFTSSMAQRAMIDGGMSKKDRKVKGNIDKISAAIILQSYLEQKAFIR